MRRKLTFPEFVRTFSIRPATVELPLCRHRLWSPRPAFTRHMNIGEVAADRVAIGDFDLCPNGDRQIIRQINGNVASRGLQRGIVAAATGRRQSDDDSSFTTIPPAEVSACTDVAPSNWILPPPVWACTRPLAEASRMLPAPVSISAGPPISPRSTLPPPVVAFTRPLHLSTRMLPPPVSSTAPCSPERTTTLPPPLSALISPLADETLMLPPPVCRLTLLPTLPTSIVPPPVSADTVAADIIHVNISTAALEVDSPGDPGRVYVAAPGLDLGGIQVTRHVDDEFIRASAILPARFGNHPGRVSLDRGVESCKIRIRGGPAVLKMYKHDDE